MADLPTGTVTFLFTDIEGSTRLLHERGREAYRMLLDEHRRLLRAAFEAANGVEIDTQGDAFFVAFPRARMAVAAAAAAQRELAALGEVKVRMGIHTGEAELADGRYVGLAVVRAQRICSAARGGQVLLSTTTRDVVEDDLPAGVRLRELGRIRLKDLERRELLFQLDIDGLPTSFPRRKAAPQGRRWWLTALAVAAVAALALGSAALISRQDGSPSGLTRVDVNAVGVIDAERNALVDQVTVGLRPTRIAAEPHGLWVVNEGDGTVSRVNAQTLAVTRTISTPGSTLDVAASADAVWVVGHQRRGNAGKGTALVYRISPADALVTNTTVIPSLALQGIIVTSVATVGQSVWVSGGLEVVRLRPATGAIAEPPVWEGGASDLAADQSSLWIAQGAEDEVDAGRATRIDEATGTVTVTVPVGNGTPHVALGYGAAWIGIEGSVKRLDATSGVTMATIPIDGIVSDITVGADAVWAADSSNGTVLRIDPKTNEVVETIRLGNRPDGIAALDGKVYVTVY